MIQTALDGAKIHGLLHHASVGREAQCVHSRIEGEGPLQHNRTPALQPKALCPTWPWCTNMVAVCSAAHNPHQASPTSA